MPVFVLNRKGKYMFFTSQLLYLMAMSTVVLAGFAQVGINIPLPF
jgi:hypothetical protein